MTITGGGTRTLGRNQHHNNFAYRDNNQVTVWKAFDVGPGKSVPWSRLQKVSQTSIHLFFIGEVAMWCCLLMEFIPFFFFQYRVNYLVYHTSSNCHLETLSRAAKRNRRLKQQNPRSAARRSMKRLLKTVAFSVAQWMDAWRPIKGIRTSKTTSCFVSAACDLTGNTTCWIKRPFFMQRSLPSETVLSLLSSSRLSNVKLLSHYRKAGP